MSMSNPHAQRGKTSAASTPGSFAPHTRSDSEVDLGAVRIETARQLRAGDVLEFEEWEDEVRVDARYTVTSIRSEYPLDLNGPMREQLVVSVAEHDRPLLLWANNPVSASGHRDPNEDSRSGSELRGVVSEIRRTMIRSNAILDEDDARELVSAAEAPNLDATSMARIEQMIPHLEDTSPAVAKRLRSAGEAWRARRGA